MAADFFLVAASAADTNADAKTITAAQNKKHFFITKPSFRK
jgi:hypothetical protein